MFLINQCQFLLFFLTQAFQKLFIKSNKMKRTIKQYRMNDTAESLCSRRLAGVAKGKIVSNKLSLLLMIPVQPTPVSRNRFLQSESNLHSGVLYYFPGGKRSEVAFSNRLAQQKSLLSEILGNESLLCEANRFTDLPRNKK